MLTNAEKLARARILVAAFNNHDPAACAACFAEEGLSITVAGVRAEGRQAIEQAYRRQFATFPDARITVLSATNGQDQLFAEYILEGTHLGPLTLGNQEFAPTGRTFKVQYLAEATFNASGQLTQLAQAGDGYAMLRQLQIAPPPHVTEEKIAGVTEELVSALNRRDVDAIAACFSPDAVFGSETMGQIRGREAIRATFERSIKAYPDAQFRVASQTIQDNTAVVTLRMQGVQSGQFPWREGTNREVAIEMTLVAQVGPMGIFACRQYMDGVRLMKQLGFLAE